MAWDSEWDPSQEDAATGKGHGEAWETLNNQLFEEWRRFNARLEDLDYQLEQLGRPKLTPARRAEHIASFRRILTQRYGLSGVDPRWEGEKAKRLEARNQQQSPYRKGGYAP